MIIQKIVRTYPGNAVDPLKTINELLVEGWIIVGRASFYGRNKGQIVGNEYILQKEEKK